MLLLFNYRSFSRYNRQQNTGEIWLFALNENMKQGLFFVIYGVVKHIIVQDYYMNLRCTAQKKNTKLSFFSVQKSVLIAIICKIIYFMKSYHDKQYENVLNMKTMKIIWEKNIFNNKQN